MAASPVLFPLWPRPGARETLEWLTTVMISEDGTEERIEKRTAPRQAFTYSYFVPYAYQARIKNIVYGGRKLEWYVPVWSQVQHVGVVADLATAIACETRYSEFRAGGYALLWESPDKCQVVQVASIPGAATLNLTDPAMAFDDAWLAPVRLGRLASDPNRTFNGKTSELEMGFDISDLAELTVPDPTQYLAADAYFDPGLLDGGSQAERLMARVDVFDEGLGPLSYLTPWDFNRPQRVHRMMAEDAAEAWAIRQFLHRRRGRSVAFWQPSFEVDLRVASTGNVTTNLIVTRDDFDLLAPERTHIAIETPTGWLPRAITGTIDLGDGRLQLALDSTLGGIAASTIQRVSFMGLRRLDTDRVEIGHIGGTVSACAVNTVEIAP